ncbi:hypothetical protein [Streptomyces griseosporeus]|uniref:hypothetical protein n=1 Tax=Streptomyces griseosporeus TaxID=1910 RepID=UPI0036FEC4EA
MRRTLATACVALTAAALALTACDDGHEQGPAGRVVAKASEQECHTVTTGTGKKARSHRECHWEYELTTRDSAGEDHTFEVPSYVFDDCRRGSAYPSCIHR